MPNRRAGGNTCPFTCLDSNGKAVVKYVYDAWGNHAVVDANGNDVTSGIGVLNPFRYRGYYYDTETELYYLQTRYYDPELGRFISQDSLEYADPETINGLNVYAYCGNNPVMNIDPSGNAWWNWVLSGLQIILGAVLIATGVGAGFGASLIIGGTIGLISNALGSTIGGGLGSMLNGWGAISTGISLFSYGIIGAIAGTALSIIGGVTMAFGLNEVVSGIVGTNLIRSWTGGELYDGLYLGFNIASAVGTVVGRLGMRLANTVNSNKASSNASPYSKVVTNKNISYYDGHGNPYWAVHDVGTSGQHWHTSFGRDGEHIYNYLEFIIKFIFRKW